MFSIALARALAVHNKILLVEADHHAPVFEALFTENRPTIFFNQYITDRGINLKNLVYATKLGFEIIYSSSKFQANDYLPSSNYDQFIERLIEVKKDFQKSDYDYIIIDLPPGVNSISVSATVFSDIIIIATRADKPSLEGTSTLLGKIYSNTIIIQNRQVHIVFNQVPDHPTAGNFIENWEIRFAVQFPFITSYLTIMYSTETGAKLMQGQFMDENDPTNLCIIEFAQKILAKSFKTENV